MTRRETRLKLPEGFGVGAKLPPIYMPHHLASQESSYFYAGVTPDEALSRLPPSLTRTWNDEDRVQYKLRWRIARVMAMYTEYISGWLSYLTDAELDEAAARAMSENSRLGEIVGRGDADET